MQIRVANKQDEPAIRSFVEKHYEGLGQNLNLDGDDADLRNIEANYFGKEGLFIIAEEDAAVTGIAGARRKNDTVLELRRLLSAPDVVPELLDVILLFAPRMLYRRVDVQLVPSSLSYPDKLEEAGFSKGKESQSWSLPVIPDF